MSRAHRWSYQWSLSVLITSSVDNFWCSDLSSGNSCTPRRCRRALHVIRASTYLHRPAPPQQPWTDSARLGAIPHSMAGKPCSSIDTKTVRLSGISPRPAFRWAASRTRSATQSRWRPTHGSCCPAHALNPHPAVQGRDRGDGRLDPDARWKRPSTRPSRLTSSGFGNSKIMPCGRHRGGKPGGS